MRCLYPNTFPVAWQVHSVAITKDPATGLGKGFGFVKYKTKEAADKAKASLHSTALKDFPASKVRAAAGAALLQLLEP